MKPHPEEPEEARETYPSWYMRLLTGLVWFAGTAGAAVKRQRASSPSVRHAISLSVPVKMLPSASIAILA